MGTPTHADFLAVYADGTEVRMRLSFKNGLWVSFNPSYSDKEIVRAEDYDWSGVPRAEGGAAFAPSLRRFEEEWERSGICPDPRVYEVEDSPWLKLIGEQPGTGRYKHFLLLGHDGYAEIIGEEWRAVGVEPRSNQEE